MCRPRSDGHRRSNRLTLGSRRNFDKTSTRRALGDPLGAVLKRFHADARSRRPPLGATGTSVCFGSSAALTSHACKLGL
jgi:hypothetical protein